MRYLIGTLLLSLLLGIAYSGISNNTTPHDFTGQCERCHLVAPQPGQKSIFVQDIDFLCKTCHQVGKGNSHPSEVVPSMKLDRQFSVDWQGRITCTTCHDPHPKSVADNQYMLKSDARGKEFCQQCHQDLFKDPQKHLSASRVAHTKSWTPPERDAIGQVLDQVSMDCLTCHEGSVGPVASFSTPDVTQLSFQGTTFSHPIGMVYAEVAENNRELRSMDDLSPLISLYEGKVGCGSCHNPFSHEAEMLVFSNKRSALCLECHLK